MQNAVIVGAVRTAVGRKNGKLAGYRPDDLLADTLKALVARVKIDPSEVEDVVMGCVDQVGEQGLNIARNAALIAGLSPRRLRHHARPHVRLRPAGRQLRGHGRDVRPVRVRDRGRRGEHEPRPDGLERHGARRRAALPAAPGALQHHPAGALGRADRRAVGHQARGARRVRRPEPRAGGAGDRGGALQAGDRPAHAGRRQRVRHRRGRAGAREPGEDGGARAVLQARRGGDRGQLLADLRRRRRAADHVGGARQGARAHPARPHRGHRAGRRGSRPSC